MKIQDILLNMGKSGCLLLDYAYLSEISLMELIDDFNDLVYENIIREDCFVKDADKLLRHFRKYGKVQKINVKDVKKDELYLASWERMGFNHFVVMQNGEIVYNTLENSKCVSHGKLNPIVRVIR